MKILIYGINFEPELTGIGKYTGELARDLASAGVDVRVITAPPYYPDWKIREGYSRWKFTVVVQPRLVVMRAPLWVPRKPSTIKRLLHLASFAITSFFWLFQQFRWKPDVVLVVEPPLMCAPAALLLAKIIGAKSWLHIQDYEVDAAFKLGLMGAGPLQSMAYSIERWLMRCFDRISTISRQMLDLARLKGVENQRLFFFPNWVDINSIVPLTGPSKYRSLLNIAEDAFVALYSGNMGGKQGLEILAEAAAVFGAGLSQGRDIHFVFCGNGAGREALMRSTSHAKNVHFLDLQPLESLGELLGLADVHLLPQRADAADLVMPSKLTGMLSSGKPVVVTAARGTELFGVVVEDAKCGLAVDPGDALAFARAIDKFASDPEFSRSCGVNARNYAEAHLSRERVISKVLEDIELLGGVRKV